MWLYDKLLEEWSSLTWVIWCTGWSALVHQCSSLCIYWLYEKQIRFRTYRSSTLLCGCNEMYLLRCRCIQKHKHGHTKCAWMCNIRLRCESQLCLISFAFWARLLKDFVRTFLCKSLLYLLITNYLKNEVGQTSLWMIVYKGSCRWSAKSSIFFPSIWSICKVLDTLIWCSEMACSGGDMMFKILTPPNFVKLKMSYLWCGV